LGPRAGLDRCGKSCPPLGFDPQTVQPVASRYTDYATRPTTVVQGFHRRMVGLKVSTEENLVGEKVQNIAYFTGITEGFHMGCMTTRHAALFLCP